jgi:protein phosphatase
VAIFRGITGEVLGVPLHTVAETSCRPGATACEEIALVDLKPAVRRDVEQGITQVDGLQGARATVTRLRTEQLLPPCSARGSGSGTTAPPPTTAPPVASGFPVPLPGDTGSPLPEVTPEPGVDCRTVG